MEILKKLSELDLNPQNSIVIGSGILNASNIRNSNDIDVVVDNSTYQKLSENYRFTKAQNHGREILTDELFEIGTGWGVLGKDQTIDDLTKQSIIIGGVRYVTLDFLLAVKESWLKDDDVRQKDIDDVKLIKEHLGK